MLGKRVASAAVLIPILAVFVYLGGFALWALALAAALLAGYEYCRLVKQPALASPYIVTWLLVTLFLLDSPPISLGLIAWGLPLITLVALALEIGAGNAPGAISRWALAVAGGIYIGYPIGSLLHLRTIDQGLWWLAMAFLGTWICDSAAYFVGVRWGKTRFFPLISPKKSWEGAWAGAAAGLAFVIPFAILVLQIAWWWAVLAGVLLVLGATFGDLAESVIKRQAGVKDSGNIIPGHGGMLDRIDSLLFVLPLMYVLSLVAA